jgi:hypothetical protein
MNHANTELSAARGAACALARNARCRRRIAVGAVCKGTLSCHITVAGAGYPSCGGQRTVEAHQTKDRNPVVREARCGLEEQQAKQSGKYRGGSHALRVRAAPSRKVSVGAGHGGPRRECWYASPSKREHKCKFKAKAKPLLAGRGLTLPSRGQLPGYALQLPLMSNVRALASIRILVVHRPVACVATVSADCPSFGGQRKVEPPAGRDSWFRYEPRARRRRCGVWLPFAAGKKSVARAVPNT